MLLIPTAVLIALILPWESDNRRTVLYWVVAFGLAGLLVSLSKILFLGFGIGSARFNFTGFSGHSAMSATLRPVMLWLISGRRPALWRGLAIGVGYMIPLMVGFSRLVIHAHSKSEVATGLLLGFTLSTAFLISQRGTALKGFSWPQIGAALLVTFVLLSHGRVATTQQFLERFSASLAGMEKPYIRADLFRQ
ncbi:hypothetical protein FD733_00885 [Pantoea sp. Eser]|nr:hypothetical protein [Pantoea sp. Eser]